MTNLSKLSKTKLKSLCMFGLLLFSILSKQNIFGYEKKNYLLIKLNQVFNMFLLL